MAKISVIDLFNIPYKEMEDKINAAIEAVESGGRKVTDFRVMGDSLNKCAVFVLHEEK